MDGEPLGKIDSGVLNRHACVVVEGVEDVHRKAFCVPA
jgi:hypothetical protein